MTTRLPYFSEDALISVRARARRDHGKLYSLPDSWVSSSSDLKAPVRVSQVEVAEIPVLECSAQAPAQSDAANAIALFERLKCLTPVQAADERLWACLTHTHYWGYMQARWSREFSSKFDRIESRWFFKGSGMERLARNGLARLWWGARATVRPGTSEPYRLTRVLFGNTEVHQGHMERLFGKSRVVLQSALEFIDENLPRIKPRQSVSDWARESTKLLNRAGGVLQLDALSRSDVFKILDDYLRDLYVRGGTG